MAKKVSFDNLPKAVEHILEILRSEGSEHSAVPEILRSMAVFNKRLDNIERLLFPDRHTMDIQTVMRLLKISRKKLSDMENAGILVSHSEGRRAFFYEDDVVRCFMNQSAWKSALEEATKPKSVESATDEPASVDAESASEFAPAGDGLIDIEAAAEMIGRTKLTIYKLTSGGKIPFVKQGAKLLFEVETLKKWMEDKSTRKRKSGSDKAVKAVSVETQGLVDIYGAGEILGRTPGAIRQHLSSLPHKKVGHKLYFDPKDLEEWASTHAPRKRKSKQSRT